jgi:endonuclease/exonuclease/phosphatase family metal-dependent hydrolase
MAADCRTKELVVASYNVHGFVGLDGRFDPERTFHVIDQLAADIVALQEVHRISGERGAGGGLDELAAKAGYELVLGATLQRDEGEFGNALLTRIEAGAVRRHDLSIDGREPRGALDARLACGDAVLRVVAVHLGLRAAERRAQVALLARRLEDEGDGGEPELTILLGDFNEWGPRGRRLEPLARRVGPLSRRATFPSRLPCFPLDRIAVRPAGALVAVRAVRSPLARRASDHLPLLARMRVQ